MKTLSLNEAWKRCLAMWKWIAENYTYGLVADAKRIWLAHHRPKDKLRDSCYFCEYARLATKSTAGGCSDCSNCPGRLVDGTFSCFAYPYTYNSYPKAFYEKLLQLNAKRLEEKNAR